MLWSDETGFEISGPNFYHCVQRGSTAICKTRFKLCQGLGQGFFLYTVFVFMSACFSKSMILSLIVQNEEMRGGLRILHNTIFFLNLNIEENKNTHSYLREQVQF